MLKTVGAVEEDVWDAAVAPDGSPEHSWAWMRSAIEVYAEGRAETTLVVGPHDAPAGLASFYATRERPCGWRLAGGIDLGKSFSIRCRDDAARTVMAERLLALRRPVDLGHYPADCPLLATLRASAGRRSVVLSRPLRAFCSPELRLGDLPDVPEEALGKSRRKSLRQRRRRAEAEHGPFQLQLLTPRPDEVNALLEEVFAVEARGWKGRAGTALAADRRQGEFYRRYGARAADRGILRLAFLNIAGKPAAAQIGVESHGTFWSIKTGYDEALADASPGLQLDIMMLGELRTRGIDRAIYLGKCEPWLERISTGAQPLVAVRLMPVSLLGAVGAAAEITRFARRRLSAKGLSRRSAC